MDKGFSVKSPDLRPIVKELVRGAGWNNNSSNGGDQMGESGLHSIT